MAKHEHEPYKGQPIKKLDATPEYSVGGENITPEHVQQVRDIVNAIAPDAYPTRIVFLPEEKWRNLTDQVKHQGSFGGYKVSPTSGEQGQESFGPGGSTSISNGLSILSTGTMYLNGALLDAKRANDLKEMVAHELGHFAAKGNHSEDAAEEWRTKVYSPRAKETLQNWKTIESLPPRHVEPLIPSPTSPFGSALATAAPVADKNDPETAAQNNKGLPKVKMPGELIQSK